MAPRTIDGPRAQWLTTVQAAQWLGLSPDTFSRLVEAHPWVRASKVGRSIRWHWMDLVCLSHILHRSGGNSQIQAGDE